MDEHEDRVETGKAEIEHIDRVYLAQTEAEEEHNASTWQTIKANPKIIALCFFANIGPLMYGFDNLATSLCLSMPAFEMQFGQLVAGSYVIPAWWQSLWNSLSQVGTMLGAWCIGSIADRFGRKVCFAISASISAAGIAVLYISATPGVFLGGKIVNAVSLGMAIAVGQTYISEITPLAMRSVALSGFTFSMVFICFTLARYMIAASVAYERLTIMNNSSYKVMFASAWVWPALFICVFWFIPESPFYLVRNKKLEQARKELLRLSPKNTNIAGKLAAIEDVIEAERSLASEARDVSFFELFDRKNWRRTRIILYCNGLSQMIGTTFLNNGPYFLVSAGLASTSVGMIVEIGISFAIASSILTWFIMPRIGNRTLMLWGTAGTIFFFILIGISGCFYTTAAKWTTGIGLQLLWWSVGPCIGPAMSISGQISQARLRAQSQSLGFAFNYFFSAVWNVCVPYMFNADQGDLGGKMGFIYFATAVISWLIIYFDVPETKGRAYADLDTMFELDLPTRDFVSWNPTAVVDA